MSKKTIKNLTQILQLIFISPIIWFGTFGENEVCRNFIYFFNFLAAFICFGVLFAKEKLLETTNDPENFYKNDYLLMAAWMIPACILVAGGWIWSGVIWFFTWCCCHSLNKDLKEKIEREKRMKDFKGE